MSAWNDKVVDSSRKGGASSSARATFYRPRSVRQASGVSMSGSVLRHKGAVEESLSRCHVGEMHVGDGTFEAAFGAEDSETDVLDLDGGRAVVAMRVESGEELLPVRSVGFASRDDKVDRATGGAHGSATTAATHAGEASNVVVLDSLDVDGDEVLTELLDCLDRIDIVSELM